MGQFVTNEVDFSAITSLNYPNPGLFILGMDVDGAFKMMDSTGAISHIGGTVRTNRILNYTNYGETLLVTDSLLFCDSNYHYISINLPSVASMQGRTMTFINTSGTYESTFLINGPFNGAPYYNLNLSGMTVTIVSDGTTWWITSTT